ncbi:hypothetical protein GCM10011497_16680 [Elstera cyanobacteriorum]|nr:hypothetical protein GCM10011497_16680 [Elstera cyanobacteriorum]
MRYEPRVGVLWGSEDRESAWRAIRQCIAKVIPEDREAELRVVFRIRVRENGEISEAEPKDVAWMKPGSMHRQFLDKALGAIRDPACRAPARQDYQPDGYQFVFDLMAGPNGWGF